MQIFCISGKIGSGKTTFSQQFIQNLSHYKTHRKHILYVNIDDFANTQKPKVYKKLNTNTQKIQKLLFYSGSHKNFRTQKMWHNLNTIFKKVIIQYIQQIFTNTLHIKYYKIIIFDLALQTYFTEALTTINNTNTINSKNTIKYITLCNTLYTKLFLLKKYRNMSFSKTIKILQQQVN